MINVGFVWKTGPNWLSKPDKPLVFLCLYKSKKDFKWDYTHRCKCQAHWPTQTGKQLLSPQLQEKLERSLQSMPCKSQIPIRKITTAGNVLAAVVPLISGQWLNGPNLCPTVICGTVYDPVLSFRGAICIGAFNTFATSLKSPTV